MPIPNFDHNNVLPPHLGNPTSPNEVSPYHSTILELCQRFATSTERIEILKGLIYFRIEAINHGITNGFQWIDGSFSENIEQSEGRAPNDIDVVSFVGHITKSIEFDIERNFEAFINTERSKVDYKVDHYPVVFDINPMITINATKYWIQLFSHNRNGVWKGIIELPLYDNPKLDNEALFFLNNCRYGNS